MPALVCATAGLLAAETPPPTPLLTKSQDALIAVLKSSADRKEKADACRELAVIGTSKAVPVLAALLANEELHHMARYALETIPGPEVNKALRDDLTRLKGRALVGVIGSLGVRKDSNAVKPLSGLLSDTDSQVAQAAVRALGQIGTPAAVRAIETGLATTTSANRLAFCEGLFRCAESFVARGKTKDAIAIYDRLRARQDVPPQVRGGALRGAILARGLSGVDLLEQSLASSDPFVFNAAVRAALDMQSSRATWALTTRLPQLPPDRQIVVMQALGARHDDAAVRPLATMVRLGDTPTRIAAVRAIAAVGTPSAVPALAELLDYPDSAISQAAVDGLAGLPGPQADAVVLNLIKSPKVSARIIGIELAGRRRMVSAVPVLLATANDAKVRASALQKLGKLASPAEVPALLKLLPTLSEPHDITLLGEALSSICTGAGAPVAATEQIIAAWSSAAPAQKRALIAVLGSVGGEKALATVRSELEDSNNEVRDAAVRALAEWPDASAAPDLLKVARWGSEGLHRELAFAGYVRIVRESSASAAEKLKSLSQAGSMAVNPQEKKQVLAGLGDILTVESLRAVTPYVTDAMVADEAGAVAVKIAERLDAKNSADVGTALNQVLKSAKSQQVLDKARKRMEQLNLTIQ